MAVQRDDLIILVADLDIQAVMEGLFEHPEKLGIRRIRPTIRRHPGRDSSCRGQAHEFLRSQINLFDFALVVFDYEGSGSEFTQTREEIEGDVEALLSQNGWPDRCAAITIKPEVENWVWSDSRKVDEVLNWTDPQLNLRQWLEQNGFLQSGETKPQNPKEAFRKVTSLTEVGHLASVFKELAKSVSHRRCTDAAFRKLVETLRAWFPPVT